MNTPECDQPVIQAASASGGGDGVKSPYSCSALLYSLEQNATLWLEERRTYTEDRKPRGSHQQKAPNRIRLVLTASEARKQ